MNRDRQAARTKVKHIASESGARMEVEKTYFTLPEILDRWSMPEADLIYLAENDRLRLSVRVFGLSVEFGDHEVTDDGRRYNVPVERKYFSGLLELNARDAFRLFRCGELVLTEFRTPKADYASLWDDAEPVLFVIGDLLLRREERDRFEAESGFSGAQTEAVQPTFRASTDYHSVRSQGRDFRLGPIQAQVVRVLHDAARIGSPWLSGKAILSAAGSRSLKMSDVFKSQPHWRDLILSNQRGLYKLAGV